MSQVLIEFQAGCCFESDFYFLVKIGKSDFVSPVVVIF